MSCDFLSAPMVERRICRVWRIVRRPITRGPLRRRRKNVRSAFDLPICANLAATPVGAPSSVTVRCCRNAGVWFANMRIEVFLAAAESVRPLIAAPQVAAAWEEPSALPGMTVGGLTAHLVNAVASINAHPDRPVPETDPIDTVTYYVSGPDTDVVSDSVREAVSARSREQAQPGPAAVLADFDGALKHLRIWLPAQSPDRLMRVPIGRCMRLGDFLVVRLVEVLVHADDLAVSVDLPGPALTEGSSDALVALFLGMCRRRHGDRAVIQAFTRRERDAVDALRAF